MYAMIFYAARRQLCSPIFVPMCHKISRKRDCSKKKVRRGKDSNIFQDLPIAVVQAPVIVLFILSPPPTPPSLPVLLIYLYSRLKTSCRVI